MIFLIVLRNPASIWPVLNLFVGIRTLLEGPYAQCVLRVVWLVDALRLIDETDTLFGLLLKY